MIGIGKCLVKIKKHIKAGKEIVLMLDFDGTLSPIMPRHEQAYLPKRTRQNLEAINRSCPVVIISGRPLDNIREKVGVSKFVYAGSHGLEWSINRESKLKHIPKYVLKMLSKIEKNLENLARKYPKILIEKKPYSVTFHYQFVSHKQESAFKEDLQKFFKPIYKNSRLRVFWDKKTIDIVPQLDWNKGHIADLIHKHFQEKHKKSLLPIYIGDSETDEDAFIALKESGVTIRVGKNKQSAAKYYIKNQKQVDRFLEWLIQEKS